MQSANITFNLESMKPFNFWHLRLNSSLVICVYVAMAAVLPGCWLRRRVYGRLPAENVSDCFSMRRYNRMQSLVLITLYILDYMVDLFGMLQQNNTSDSAHGEQDQDQDVLIHVLVAHQFLIVPLYPRVFYLFSPSTLKYTVTWPVALYHKVTPVPLHRA